MNGTFQSEYIAQKIMSFGVIIGIALHYVVAFNKFHYNGGI